MAKQNWKPGNMLYPVPAVMVSCQRPGEKPNIVTIAWAGTICSDPAMVSISVRPERYSYDIIKETGEFTINLVTEKLAFATDYCGVKSGRDVDKFKEMNLHACDGVNVSCPAIEESPVNVECKVKQVVELVNKERNKNGLASLTMDSELNRAAAVRAKETAQSFSHTRPNGSSCFTALDEIGYSYSSAGENIAMGQSSPSEVVKAWMNSEGHRANILNSSFTKIGVGCHSNGSTLYWSQFFAG